MPVIADRSALDTAVRRFPWLLRQVRAGVVPCVALTDYPERIRAEYRLVLAERAKQQGRTNG